VPGSAPPPAAARALHVPVIFPSAYCEPEPIERAVTARCYGSPMKPREVSTLHAIVQRAVARFRASR